MEVKNLKILGTILFLTFLFLGIEELEINPINAFVLFVTAFTFLRGLQKGESYLYTASLIAVVFGLISALVVVASFANGLLLGEEPEFNLEWSLMGILLLPILSKFMVR